MMSLDRLWATGLLRRGGRVAGAALGVAVAVALVATLAGFFAATQASMTRQAIADVAVDWQVLLAPGADPQAAIAELSNSPGVSRLAQVGYADTPGFEATTGGTVQTTGPGKVVGLDPNYRATFPGEIRDLVGGGGALLAQQTAANLHAAPGTVVTVKRPGLAPVQVTIDGVVDLPLADSLFQAVGAPVGAAPQAPPDNVLLLPLDRWHALFDPVAAIAPDQVRLQLHTSLPHDLPPDPSAAYLDVTGMARNYETRMAGAAVVGDNLAARLDVARSDSLYANVLFLFLGLPGILLASGLTAALVAANAATRRRDQALLRLRGASPGQLLRLAGVEALIIGLGGSALGLVFAAGLVRAVFGQWGFGADTTRAIGWSVAAALAGVLLAGAMILVPAWRDARRVSVASARVAVGRVGAPWWERAGIDLILLALSAVVFWRQAQGGYELILAPEGTPRVAVAYSSFFAPLLFWAGATLLIIRLARLALAGRGRFILPPLRLVGGRLTPLVGASLSRQRGRLAVGLALIALAIAFAASTAIFNATYEAQALVDAELTNGADVTASGGQGIDLWPAAAKIAALPGVAAVQPMQHRFAYVGVDLQDLYGIDPMRLADAARLSDSFFTGARAADAMAGLARTPDGVLVSPETVTDFQLQPGDTIRLRLQRADDHQYDVVPFRYVGIAREFPTAPSDSFLVANAAYIAQQTGSAAAETLLIRTNQSPAAVANRVRQALGPISGATVHDIEAQRRLIRSGLTAVSLHGLTQIELFFAIALAAAGAGLVLALGLDERRRTLAIAAALGATPRQLGAFIWGEAGLLLGGGIVLGAALGGGVAWMMIMLLTHVFDPPPDHASIPWGYLALVVAATTGSVLAAGQAISRIGRRQILETIRGL